MKLINFKNVYDHLADNYERFMVSQVGIWIRNKKCLILKFSDNDCWGFPGGRIDKFEDGGNALRRELREEIGLDKFNNFGVADYDIFYTPKRKRAVCAIANLIEADDYEIRLSSEHSEFKWVSEEELDDIDFIWPNAKRLAKNGFRLKKLLEKNGK